MKEDMKHRLDEQAYEKLRETIKEYTRFNNLTVENIEVRREVLKVINIWLEKIYQLDTKPIETDEEGADLNELFNNG